MSDNHDARKYPRIKIRVPNSLRIKVKDSDCVADLLDISKGGVGAEFFDLFDVLVFTEGDVVKLQFLLKPQQVDNKNAKDVLDMIRKQQTSSENTVETDNVGESKEQNLEVDAKIVWTYLNKLGLEFVV
ncbi:MAG: PilZ domain-containing protein [Desulfomonilaceae bacterium]